MIQKITKGILLPIFKVGSLEAYWPQTSSNLGSNFDGQWYALVEIYLVMSILGLMWMVLIRSTILKSMAAIGMKCLETTS